MNKGNHSDVPQGDIREQAESRSRIVMMMRRLLFIVFWNK